MAAPINRVAVVGAGGTGSIFLSHLCRIWQAWTQLGGRSFDIDLFDMDNVSEANLARQCFCPADVGSNKAIVLAQRMRAFYGVPVTARAHAFGGTFEHDLIVGCVDNLSARRNMRDTQAGYWLDIGNDTVTAQVILGGRGLPDFFDTFPDMQHMKEFRNTPSCSMAEALEKQDLFINSTAATFAGQLLWTLMRKGGVNHHGYYINLSTGRTVPIPVPA